MAVAVLPTLEQVEDDRFMDRFELLAATCRATDTPLVIRAPEEEVRDQLQLFEVGVTSVLPPLSIDDESLSLAIYDTVRLKLEHQGVVFALTTDSDFEARLTRSLDDYRILCFSEPETMLTEWARTPPEVVVLDHQAKDLNVFVIGSGIHQMGGRIRVPVVHLVQDAVSPDREKAFEAGADDVWICPISEAEIRARVERLIEYNHLQAEVVRSRLELDEDTSAASASGKEVSVLVADDNDAMRDLLDHYLTDQGWSVTCVGDGRLAEQHLAQSDFDFVVLDLMMPFRNGFEVLERYRDEPHRSHTHLIVLTAADRDEDALRAFGLGADDFVTKPFSPDVLIARMKRCRRMRTG